MNNSTWRLFPPAHETIDKGHGRLEVRRIWTSTELNEYVKFPHVGQVIRIENHCAKLDGSDATCEVRFGVTSLSPQAADPERLLLLNRGHWSIENKVHYVRDVTFDEDRSQVGARSAAHAMASLRNLAMNVFRASRVTNLAAAVRHCSRHLAKVLRLLGL